MDEAEAEAIEGQERLSSPHFHSFPYSFRLPSVQSFRNIYKRQPGNGDDQTVLNLLPLIKSSEGEWTGHFPLGERLSLPFFSESGYLTSLLSPCPRAFLRPPSASLIYMLSNCMWYYPYLPGVADFEM